MAIPQTIRIHPPSEGRMTDPAVVSRLSSTSPSSFRKAQDLLVATQKYLAGPGFLRLERSLISNMQSAIYDLRRAIIADRYRADLHSEPVSLVFAYLSEFSDAFPNWQDEYATLNRFVPLCLDGM